jgi:hypothetical protein
VDKPECGKGAEVDTGTTPPAGDSPSPHVTAALATLHLEEKSVRHWACKGCSGPALQVTVRSVVPALHGWSLCLFVCSQVESGGAEESKEGPDSVAGEGKEGESPPQPQAQAQPSGPPQWMLPFLRPAFEVVRGSACKCFYASVSTCIGVAVVPRRPPCVPIPLAIRACLLRCVRVGVRR